MARLCMTRIKDTVDFGFFCNKYFITMQIFSLIALSSSSEASVDRSNDGKIDPVKFNISGYNQTNQNNITTDRINDTLQFSSTTLDQNMFLLTYALINISDINSKKKSTEYTHNMGFNESNTTVSVNKCKENGHVITSLQNIRETTQTPNNTENETIRSRKRKTSIKKFKKTSRMLKRKKNRRENKRVAEFISKKIKNNTLSMKYDNNTHLSNVNDVNNRLNLHNSSNNFDNCTLSLGMKKLNIFLNENNYSSTTCLDFGEYFTVRTTNKCKTDFTINDRQKREENSEQVDSADNIPGGLEFNDLDSDYDLYSDQNVINGIQNDETKASSNPPLKQGSKRGKKPKNTNHQKQNSSKINNNLVTDSYRNQYHTSKADVMKREEIDENTALLYLMKSLLENDVIENDEENSPNGLKSNKSSSILQLINNSIQSEKTSPPKKDTETVTTDKASFPFHFNIYFYNNQEDESTESSEILNYPIIMPTRIPDLINHQDDPGGSEKKGMYRESFMDYGRSSSGESSVSCPGGCNMGSVVLAILGVFIGTAVLAVLMYFVVWKFLKRKICGCGGGDHTCNEKANEPSEAGTSCDG